MDYLANISDFQPENEQEESDKRLILQFAQWHPDSVLSRENETAHITSSGFILNDTLDRALMARHNIRGVWAWPGGHADGDTDLYAVALREAREETGAVSLRPISKDIASLDILTVRGHWKRGRYVSAHLHLSVAYIFVCDEGDALRVKPDENSAVAWMDTALITSEHFSDSDVYLYNKLIRRARAIWNS